MGSKWGCPPCLGLSGGGCSIGTPAFPKVASLEEQKDFSVHSDTQEGRKEGETWGKEEGNKGGRDRDMEGRMDEGALVLQ